MRSLITFILVFALASFTTSNSSYTNNTKLSNAIDAFNNSPNLKNATWGLAVHSLRDGALVGGYNTHKSLTPASTLKIVTTEVALATLGADFTFETQLAYDGSIDANGILNGNLYIIGGGDPTLGNMREGWKNTSGSVLLLWSKAIEAQGIRSVNGYIIGDGSFFEDETVSPKWIFEDLGNYYGAGANGLNYHENYCSLVFKSGASGRPTTLVETIPPVADLRYVNRVKAGASGSGDNAYVFGVPYNDTYFVRGTIPPNHSKFMIKGALPDPAYFCAQELVRKLKDIGIDSKGASSFKKMEFDQQIIKTGRKTTFHTLESLPLKDIVYWTNKRSINLFAECLLRMIGKRKYGVGSRENGIKAIEGYLKNHNIDNTGFSIHDGSGLSPVNLVTPTQISELLCVAPQEQTYWSFKSSLSVAGDPADDGFLKSFLTGTAAAKNLRAKSGYMSGVRSYAGYVNSKTQGQLSFCLLLNHYACSNAVAKKEMGKLLAALAEM